MIKKEKEKMQREVSMTTRLEEMERELIYMRRLEQYLIKTLGEEEYRFLVYGFAREVGREKLIELGASEEVAENIINNTDIELKIKTIEQ